MSTFETLTFPLSIISLFVAIISAIIAIVAADKARAANAIAESALRFQVLVPALTDYMSAEMYIAISNLWAFYQLDPNTLVDRYNEQRNSDDQVSQNLASGERVEFIKSTINFHRRRVGQFYGMLTAIYDDGDLQKEWLYKFWRKRELQILPRIIIPLEHALAQSINSEVPKLSMDRLKKLHDDCPD